MYRGDVSFTLRNFVCNSYKYMQVVTDCMSSVDPRSFVFMKTFISVATLLCADMFQKETYAVMRQGVNAKACKIEQSAVFMLLEMVCDVVLSLDSNLQIIDDAPRSAAMLMLETTRSFQGMELRHFMHFMTTRIAFKVSCFLPVPYRSSLRAPSV